MRLKNVYEVVYSYPTNFGYEEETVYFDNYKEANEEFKKQLPSFKEDAKDTDDDIMLIIRHNDKLMKGFRNLCGNEGLEKL